MKNQIYKLFFGKNAYVSLLVVFTIMLFVGLGCSGGKKDSKPVPAEYHGAWTGSDGSTITIRSDNSGDYKSGGTKVDNGTVAINDADKTLSISFFGIGPTLKIDQPASGNSMKLDGIVYKKSGSTDSKEPVKSSEKSDTKNSYDKADASKEEMPSDDELQDIVKTTLMDFNDAVADADFTDFHSKISRAWKKQTTPADMETTFKAFIDSKVDISDISPLDATFSPDPIIEKELGYQTLKLDGKYSTSPNSTKFFLHYIPEGKEWKLSSIRVSTKPD